MTLTASTPPVDGGVGSFSSPGTLCGSGAGTSSSGRTTLDVAIGSAQAFTSSTATGATTPPRQQTTLNVHRDQRGGPTHQPAFNTRDFPQGAYIQQDHAEGMMPEVRLPAPLAHTHNSAGSVDPTQPVYEHWHHGNTLPPIRTLFEHRERSSTPPGHDRWRGPTGHDRWRGQRQYHRGRLDDNTSEHSCDKNCDTYESHIWENRHLVVDLDSGKKIPVHGTSHIGPPLKPLDPPAAELVAQHQQLYLLRQEEAGEYPVFYT